MFVLDGGFVVRAGQSLNFGSQPSSPTSFGIKPKKLLASAFASILLPQGHMHHNTTIRSANDHSAIIITPSLNHNNLKYPFMDVNPILRRELHHHIEQTTQRTAFLEPRPQTQTAHEKTPLHTAVSRGRQENERSSVRTLTR